MILYMTLCVRSLYQSLTYTRSLNRTIYISGLPSLLPTRMPLLYVYSDLSCCKWWWYIHQTVPPVSVISFIWAQFSLNNVHKRGLKHHHFILYHSYEKLDSYTLIVIVCSIHIHSHIIIISRGAEGPGREILQRPRPSVRLSVCPSVRLSVRHV